MKKHNPIVKKTNQDLYENIYTIPSKLLIEFFYGFDIELDEVYAYDS